MIHGLDTSFLVALELADHPNHAAAQRQLARLLADSDEIAIAPQVLTEFIHIVTDVRRFVRPLDMTAANRAAIEWWMSQHTVRVFPDERSALQFLAWMQEHSFGRKQLLDTLLAATYESAGIKSILTANPRDFERYGCFQLVTPESST